MPAISRRGSSRDLPPWHIAYPISLKLKRAQQQRDALRDEIIAFQHGLDADLRVCDVDPSSGDKVFRYAPPSPPLMWSVQLGEMLHNLRSYLDNLAWALVVHDRGDPMAGRTGFPVMTDRKKFMDESRPGGRWMLKGMGAKGIAAIKRHQPYRERERGNPDHGLELLHNLWNIDKHRVLHVFALDCRLQFIRVTPERDPGRSLTQALPGAIKPGAELVRIPRGVDTGRVNVETQISARVVIDKAESAGLASRPAIYGAFDHSTSVLHGLCDAAAAAGRELYACFSKSRR